MRDASIQVDVDELKLEGDPEELAQRDEPESGFKREDGGFDEWIKKEEE